MTDAKTAAEWIAFIFPGPLDDDIGYVNILELEPLIERILEQGRREGATTELAASKNQVRLLIARAGELVDELAASKADWDEATDLLIESCVHVDGDAVMEKNGNRLCDEISNFLAARKGQQ